MSKPQQKIIINALLKLHSKSLTKPPFTQNPKPLLRHYHRFSTSPPNGVSKFHLNRTFQSNHISQNVTFRQYYACLMKNHVLGDAKMMGFKRMVFDPLGLRRYSSNIGRKVSGLSVNGGGNLGKKVMEKPMSIVKSSFGQYKEAIGLQIEGIWKRNYLFVIPQLSHNSCMLLHISSLRFDDFFLIFPFFKIDMEFEEVLVRRKKKERKKEGNHKSNPNQDQVKEDMMKDVACLLFTTPTRLSYYSVTVTVYLIHIARQKLVTFLHLYDNCTSNVGFVVYKSKLYIFGGWSKHVDLPDAYVLDLYQLAKATSCLDKPSPTKLAPMNSGKSHAVALLVRDKILVLDTYVGHESNSCHFELYDPDLNTWTQVPDPCHLSTGSFVNAHYVKDDKVFMYIRKKQEVFVLSIGATTSPSWSHHVDIGYGDLCYNPFRESEGVIFGSWLVCLYDVCDLEDERCFASYTGSVVWTDKTGTKPYDISREFSSKIFRLGSDKVCTIKPAIVYKPKHIKPKVQKVKMDGRKSMLVQQSVIRKRQGERKGSFRMIVKVCSVNAISETGALMEVLKSFTVPIYRDNSKLKSHTMPLYPGPDAELGEIKMVSLCHP